MCKCASCDQLSFPFSAIILPQYLCNLQFKLINTHTFKSHAFKNKSCWEKFCLAPFVQINLWAITNSGFHLLVFEHTSLGQTCLWLLQTFIHNIESIYICIIDTSSTNVDIKKLYNQAPTYDDQFPTLGGGPGAPRAATAKPFGEWTNKPRVQSSTITQVMFALLAKYLLLWCLASSFWSIKAILHYDLVGRQVHSWK